MIVMRPLATSTPVVTTTIGLLMMISMVVPIVACTAVATAIVAALTSCTIVRYGLVAVPEDSFRVGVASSGRHRSVFTTSGLIVAALEWDPVVESANTFNIKVSIRVFLLLLSVDSIGCASFSLGCWLLGSDPS